MPGFSNITGQESIMYADNASFDGTERGGRMTTDGQLWIGASSSPYVRLATLTNGNNITFTNGPGSITANVTGTTQYAVQVGSASGALTSLGTGSAGQILQSGGAAANPSYSTATYPSTAGTAGNVLTSDGTNWVSSTPGNTSQTANAVIDLVDDFIGNFNAALSGICIGQMSWNPCAGTFRLVPNQSGAYGIISFSAVGIGGVRGIILGDTTSGQSTSLVSIGSGEITLQWFVKLATLSDVTNTYTARIGMGDVYATAPANGVWFEYTNAVNSGNWTIKSANASTTTTANTSTTANTNWNVFKIIINAAGTSVAYYINGTQVANSPLATNIPTYCSPLCSIIQSAGLTADDTLLIDLFTLRQVLTTPR